MKICSKCGAENNNASMFCEKCGEKLPDSTNEITSSNKKNKKWWLLLLIPVALIVIYFLYIFVTSFIETFNKTITENNNSNNVVNENNNNNSNNSNNSTNNNSSSNSIYKLDTPFTFDDLEITISSNYSFVTLENRYSEKNGSSVIKLPVTVKNLKNETHNLNMFYISYFGSQGTELDNVSAYFDDTIEYGGDLRTGASYTKYFYILYDGDGTYTIELDNWSDKIDIDINITK